MTRPKSNRAAIRSAKPVANKPFLFGTTPVVQVQLDSTEIEKKWDNTIFVQMFETSRAEIFYRMLERHYEDQERWCRWIPSVQQFMASLMVAETSATFGLQSWFLILGTATVAASSHHPISKLIQEWTNNLDFKKYAAFVRDEQLGWQKARVGWEKLYAHYPSKSDHDIKCEFDKLTESTLLTKKDKNFPVYPWINKLAHAQECHKRSIENKYPLLFTDAPGWVISRLISSPLNNFFRSKENTQNP